MFYKNSKFSMFYILQSFLLFAIILLFPKMEIDKIIANIIAKNT